MNARFGRLPALLLGVTLLGLALVLASSDAPAMSKVVTSAASPGEAMQKHQAPGIWTFELRLGRDAAASDDERSLESLIARVERVSGVRLLFAKGTGWNRVALTSREPMSRAAVMGVRSQLQALPEVDWVSVIPAEGLPDKAAAGAASDAPTVVGFVLMPTQSAVDEGFVAAGTLTERGLESLRALTGVPFAEARAMAGGMIALSLPQAVDASRASELKRMIEAAPFVRWVELDSLAQPAIVPNDTFFSQQWNLSASAGGIHATQAWDITTGTAAPVIAVIDTGIVSGHPDIAGRLIPGFDFISDPARARDGSGIDSDPSDAGNWSDPGQCSSSPNGRSSSWHGTHVAGILGAASNNGYGVAGVNWAARVMPVRVLGLCGGSRSDIVNAMYWAAGLPVPGAPANPNPARVLNMSLGSRSTTGCSADYQRAIDDVTAAGALVVVSAGNDEEEAAFFQPAGCENVLSVGATDHLGYISSFSNFSQYFRVQISAPGGDQPYYRDRTVDILSLVDDGTREPQGSYAFAYYHGTSMAAPHVAGAAALLLSANPSLTPRQLFWTLVDTTKDFPTNATCYLDTVCGAGILNVHAALLRTQSSPANGPTTVSLSASPNPAVVGQPITLMATVPTPGATGAVAFLDPQGPLANCSNVPLSSGGIATCLASAATPATYSLQAFYGGDYTHHWNYSPPLSLRVLAPSSPLAASVLPSSRAVTVNAAASAFATVINTKPTAVQGCSIRLPDSVPATLAYQTTHPSTNALVGTPNTPVDLAPGAAQTFLLTVRASQPLAQDIALQFSCAGGERASSISGVNTFFLTASSQPTPDVIALAATPGGDGIVRAPRGGAAAFSVAAVNVGVSGPVTVTVEGTGGAVSGARLSMCSTNASGACQQTPTTALSSSNHAAGQSATFSVFVMSTGGSVPLDPANTRVFVRFRSPGGVSLGATSVAFQTQ